MVAEEATPGKRCGHLGGGNGGCWPANAWSAGRFGGATGQMHPKAAGLSHPSVAVVVQPPMVVA